MAPSGTAAASPPQRTLGSAAPPPTLAGHGARTLARSPADGSSSAGAGTGGGGGGDGDQIYSEVMRRVREEQEQLGQLISHPF
jgi:hypothetical protein